MEADMQGLGGASEGDVRGNSTDIIEDTGGVVDLVGGHLLVHEAGSPAMSAIIDAGVGYIPNTSFDELDSDSIKFWEAVVAGTTGDRTLSIGSNSSGQTRIDLICLKIEPSTIPDSEASNVASLVVVAGTPGAGAPAIPDYHLLLAEVTVVNGATEIEDADIADQREQITLKSEFVNIQDTVLTLTNKRITKRVGTTASSSTPTPASDDVDMYTVTALAAGATFGAPTGTPTNGQTLIIRIKDNGTARSLAWNAAYRASGYLPLPTTTLVNKTLYCGFIYNSADSKWDLLAYLDNF